MVTCVQDRASMVVCYFCYVCFRFIEDCAKRSNLIFSWKSLIANFYFELSFDEMSLVKTSSILQFGPLLNRMSQLKFRVCWSFKAKLFQGLGFDCCPLSPPFSKPQEMCGSSKTQKKTESKNEIERNLKRSNFGLSGRNFRSKFYLFCRKLVLDWLRFFSHN